VNAEDPSGLCTTVIGGITQSPSTGNPLTDEAVALIKPDQPDLRTFLKARSDEAGTATNYPVSAGTNMTYNYASTKNNGRIVSSSDAVTGENVSYTYDSLNRLIAAATTNSTGPISGESYTYDGFGNLTSKTPTKGSAPSAPPQVNSATNQARMIGDNGFDANGNWLGAGGSQSNTWNVENQLISNGTVDPSGDLLTYTYDPWGKRVLQYAAGASGVPAGGTAYFYSITGQRLGTYQVSYVNSNDPPLPQTTPLYFGSRLLAPVDRLGSLRQNQGQSVAYYPWGEERPGANGTTPDGTDKFATYFRDVTNNGVGEDYAGARYYNNNFGRFWSPDPAGYGAARRRNPISWNRYAYANDDPVNRLDPSGRESANPDPNDPTSGQGTGCSTTFADEGGVTTGGWTLSVCWYNGSGSPTAPCVGEDCDTDTGGGDSTDPPLTCSEASDFLPVPRQPGRSMVPDGNGGYVPVLGWFAPSSFTFTARGGTGSYTWSESQWAAQSWGMTSGGVSTGPQGSTGPDLPLYGTQDGSTMKYVDAPGLKVNGNTPTNDLFGISGYYTGIFVLTVTVKSGDQEVTCPMVDWGVDITVTNGWASGSAWGATFPWGLP
jgi:RHS repeat-associated protein